MCAPKFLSNSEKSAVQEAIAAAEKETAAEIVCAVATESGRYDRAEAISGIIGAVLALGLVNYVPSLLQGDVGVWGAGTTVHLGWQVAAVVIGFLIGNLAASYIPQIRRVFTSQKEMEEETERAAAFVFATHGLARTAGRGGVLIYVSTYERRVVVLVDQGALEAGGNELPELLMDLAIMELRAGRRQETFTKTIAEASERLSKALPVQPDDQDELSNELLIFHPRP